MQGKENIPWKSSWHNRGNNGFTLVELLITLVLSGIIMAAIYGAYIAQQRTYLAQEDVAEMQQNVRAAIYMLASELRMAGYDDGSGAGATIETAGLNQVRFTADLNGDGDYTDDNEDLSYDINTATDGITKLGRRDNNDAFSPPKTEPDRQYVAENFDYLEFEYLDDQGDTTTVVNDMRAIRIHLLARANTAAKDYDNTGLTYAFPSGPQGPYNDNVRRRLYVTTVNLRNMGL